MFDWTTACRTGLAAWALIAASLPALAQQPMYEIHNASDQPVAFATMDPARGTWRSQQLQPNERKNLVWASGATEGKIRIGTEGRGYVLYEVRAGQKYAVVWSDRKGVWDLAGRGPMAQAGAALNTPPPSHRGGTQQAVGYGSPQHPQPSASWTLHNRSNERIEFQTFDPARGTWKNQVSYPHQTTPYTLSPGVASGKIRVGTANRGYVEYDVEAGGSYSIVWNRQSGVWDVRTRRDG